MEYFYENGTIYEGTNPIATVVVERSVFKTPKSIVISGDVQITMKLVGAEFQVFENDILMGHLKGTTLDYQGTVYKIRNVEWMGFIRGNIREIKLKSLAEDVAEISRKDNRLFISSIAISDKTPLLIYLSFLSSYSSRSYNRRITNVPSEYRIIFYVLLVADLVFIMVGISFVSAIEYAIITIGILIVAYVVYYYGLSKGKKKDSTLQQKNI